jgi:hypothetical protein
VLLPQADVLFFANCYSLAFACFACLWVVVYLLGGAAFLGREEAPTSEWMS